MIKIVEGIATVNVGYVIQAIEEMVPGLTSSFSPVFLSVLMYVTFVVVCVVMYVPGIVLLFCLKHRVCRKTVCAVAITGDR